MRERPILFSAPMVRALLAGTKTQTRRVVKPQPHSDVHQDCESGEWGQHWYSLDDRHDPTVEHWKPLRCPYGVPGDRLYVREAWRVEARCNDIAPRDLVHDWPVAYGAGVWSELRQGVVTVPSSASSGRLRPGIHMPRWASRILLEVTEVRVERLQDISEADAIAEGLHKSFPDDDDRDWYRAYCEDVGAEPDWVSFEAGVWMVPGVPQGWGMTKTERQRDQWAPTPQFAYRQLWDHINGPGGWVANPWVFAVSFKRAES